MTSARSPAVLTVMPNERPLVRTQITNRVMISPCCPVSGNPRPGSFLSVIYTVGESTLEVQAFKDHVEEYIDGHPGGIRNMETMIQQIAQDCANALGVPVRLEAFLELLPEQSMWLTCEAVAR